MAGLEAGGWLVAGWWLVASGGAKGQVWLAVVQRVRYLVSMFS